MKKKGKVDHQISVSGSVVTIYRNKTDVTRMLPESQNTHCGLSCLGFMWIKVDTYPDYGK